MLCYRGVRYIPSGHLYQTEAGEVIGKYRGLEVRSRHLKCVVPQPSYGLIYRGISYASGNIQSAHLAPN